MRKHLLIIGLALTTNYLQAQIVNIPDAKFKAALLANTSVNTNKDAEIQLSEAQAVQDLYVSNLSIADLTGIEYFTALTNLSCFNNQLSNLNISKNKALTRLSCFSNQLTLLNLASNTELRDLFCDDNKLTFLDIRDNINLTSLWCHLNPNLPQICINTTQASKIIGIISTNWRKDNAATWSTTCDIITAIEKVNVETTPKTLIRILTPLGQELQPEQATDGLFIHQYSDGSTRKIAK